VGAVGTVRSATLLQARVPGVGLSIERLRGEVRDAMIGATGPGRGQAAGILAALAIGDQAAIDPALWTLFNQTGVGHLMSISGLHITLLAGLGGSLAGRVWQMKALSRLGLPARLPAQVVRLSAAVVVAFAYTLLSGWGIPAQRTCFMLTVAALLLGYALLTTAMKRFYIGRFGWQ
jgi:competence protein ComEC